MTDPVIGKSGTTWLLFITRDGAEASGAAEIHTPTGDLLELATKLFAPNRKVGTHEALRTRIHHILGDYTGPPSPQPILPGMPVETPHA